MLMEDSPSACSWSRIWPPLGLETWTTRTSAPRRLARSATGSTAFWAAQGLLTAIMIRLITVRILPPWGAGCIPVRPFATQGGAGDRDIEDAGFAGLRH